MTFATQHQPRHPFFVAKPSATARSPAPPTAMSSRRGKEILGPAVLLSCQRIVAVNSRRGSLRFLSGGALRLLGEGRERKDGVIHPENKGLTTSDG
jgi:hypothetical protein